MTPHTRRFLAALVAALAFVCSALAGQDKLFPDLDGWKQGEMSVYTPENLYVPIDGAADLFIRYHFEEMKTLEYSNGSEAFTVEAYRQATPLDAYGIYSQGRPAKESYLQIGVQGYVESDLLNFLAGRHYVEMRTSTPGEKTLAAMKAVAARMAEALNGGATIPKLFDCFPAKSRKPSSEKYLAKDILGYEFLQKAFQVEYETADGAYTLFAMRGDNETEAAAMLGSYYKQLKISPSPVAGGYIEVNDSYHGRVSLWLAGRYLLCLSGKISPEAARSILAELKSQIEKSKE